MAIKYDKVKYHEYLNSPEWKDMKAEIVKERGDLQLLCRKCHKDYHQTKDALKVKRVRPKKVSNYLEPIKGGKPGKYVRRVERRISKGYYLNSKSQEQAMSRALAKDLRLLSGG